MQPLKWTDRSSRDKLLRQASRILNEFYDFQGYSKFGNILEAQKENGTYNEKWIHDTFDNRLIIVDEAHNLRDTSETEVDAKIVSAALEKIVKTAHGITLVLLTATPMFDTFEEILHYFNLFEWNSRRQAPTESMKSNNFFTLDGDFISADARARFHRLCQMYVSYVRGDNPFTFPFRLPPPKNMIALKNRTQDLFGKKITKRLTYLELTQSIMSEFQESVVSKLTPSSLSEPRTVCVYPENKSFYQVFTKEEGQYRYVKEKFLAPSMVGTYSAKFATVMRCIQESKGIVFVYSNMVESGARLFGMCLEEHGLKSAFGDDLLIEPSGEVQKGSRGTYALFTSETQASDIKKTLATLRSQENKNGDIVRVVVASPKVSEGVDFRYVRQIHVLDPWYNMSRIEQVLGRGMRTCSHSLLPFELQNCTIYLHICRYPKTKRETLDEYFYRVFIEEKAQKIAKVKRVVMESAMDCELQNSINTLPPDWRNEKVPQIRAQDKKELKLSLSEMFAPTFEEKISGIVCQLDQSEPDLKHSRPLSSILDVRDEVFDKLIKLFTRKPIWSLDDLVKQPTLKEYDPNVVLYLIQNAIDTPLRIGEGHLETKGDFVAYSTGENQTMLERILKQPQYQEVLIPQFIDDEEEKTEVPALDSKRTDLPGFVQKFSSEVKDWYIVDAVLTKQEKVAYLLAGNWDRPYSTPLKTGNIYVMGLTRVFDSNLKPVVPVGEQLDEYKAWRKALEDKFIERKTDIFASMKDDKIIFNLNPKSDAVEVVGRSKTIGGQACTSFKEETLNSFAKWLNGKSFPEEAKGKKDRCLYLNFLIREAILAGKQGLYWITPEEFEVLNEKGNKELREKLR
jgi:hypothetical protein